MGDAGAEDAPKPSDSIPKTVSAQNFIFIVTTRVWTILISELFCACVLAYGGRRGMTSADMDTYVHPNGTARWEHDIESGTTKSKMASRILVGGAFATIICLIVMRSNLEKPMITKPLFCAFIFFMGIGSAALDCYQLVWWGEMMLGAAFVQITISGIFWRCKCTMKMARNIIPKMKNFQTFEAAEAKKVAEGSGGKDAVKANAKRFQDDMDFLATCFLGFIAWILMAIGMMIMVAFYRWKDDNLYSWAAVAFCVVLASLLMNAFIIFEVIVQTRQIRTDAIFRAVILINSAAFGFEPVIWCVKAALEFVGIKGSKNNFDEQEKLDKGETGWGTEDTEAQKPAAEKPAAAAAPKPDQAASPGWETSN